MGAPQTRDIRPDLGPFTCGSGTPLIYTNTSCLCVLGGGCLFCLVFLGFVFMLAFVFLVRTRSFHSLTLCYYNLLLVSDPVKQKTFHLTLPPFLTFPAN